MVKSSRPDYGAASISSFAINKVVSESNDIQKKTTNARRRNYRSRRRRGR